MLSGSARLTALNIVQPGLPLPRVNVVFFHGLNEDWCKSWGLDRAQSWKSYLGNACPQANIWSVDYQIHWSEYGGGAMSLYERAVNVLGTIHLPLDDGLPLVLLGHSYGGLLIKQMLRTGRDENYQKFVEKVKGIGFFGVPHGGAGLADFADRLSAIGRTSKAIGDLKTDNEGLAELSSWFRNYSTTRRWKIANFRETRETPPGVMVVDIHSSDPGIASVPSHGVDANHNEVQLPGKEGDLRLTIIGDMVRGIARGRRRELPAPLLDAQSLSDLTGDAIKDEIARQKETIRVGGENETSRALIQYLERRSAAAEKIAELDVGTSAATSQPRRPRRMPPWLEEFLRDPHSWLPYAVSATLFALITIVLSVTDWSGAAFRSVVCKFGPGEESTYATAAIDGDIAKLKELKSKCADPAAALDDKGTTAPMLVAMNGNVEAMKLLLDTDIFYPPSNGQAQVDSDRNTLLHRAAYGCHPDMIQFLARRYPELLSARNEGGLTPAVLAAGYCRINGYLAFKGMEVSDFQGPAATTSGLDVADDLQVAISRDDTLAFETIVEAARIAKVNWEGLLAGEKSLLHLAARKGPPGIASVAVRSDPSGLDVADKDGMTPLAIAAFEHHDEVVDVLLIAGASLRDGSGSTKWIENPPAPILLRRRDQLSVSLRDAVENGSKELSELIRRGADPTRTIDDTGSALSAAAKRPNDEEALTLVRLLAAAPARTDGNVIDEGAFLATIYSVQVGNSMPEDGQTSFAVLHELVRLGYRPASLDMVVPQLLNAFREHKGWDQSALEAVLGTGALFLNSLNPHGVDPLQHIVRGILTVPDAPRDVDHITGLLDRLVGLGLDPSVGLSASYQSLLNVGGTEADLPARRIIFDWLDRRAGLPTAGGGLLKVAVELPASYYFDRLVTSIQSSLEAESDVYAELYRSAVRDPASMARWRASLDKALDHQIPVPGEFEKLILESFLGQWGEPNLPLTEHLLERGVISLQTPAIIEERPTLLDSLDCPSEFLKASSVVDQLLRSRINLGNSSYTDEPILRIRATDGLVAKLVDRGQQPHSVLFVLCTYVYSWDRWRGLSEELFWQLLQPFYDAGQKPSLEDITTALRALGGAEHGIVSGERQEVPRPSAAPWVRMIGDLALGPIPPDGEISLIALDNALATAALLWLDHTERMRVFEAILAKAPVFGYNAIGGLWRAAGHGRTELGPLYAALHPKLGVVLEDYDLSSGSVGFCRDSTLVEAMSLARNEDIAEYCRQ